MQRRKFLFDLVRAAAAVAIAPSALPIQSEPLKEPYVMLPNYDEVSLRRYKKSFKVSNEMLEDEKAFSALCNELGVPYQQPDMVEVGYDGDDFIRNVKTVVLTYYHV